MVKKIVFTGNEKEDIKRMLSSKEFVHDLRIIGFMKKHPPRQISKPKDI